METRKLWMWSLSLIAGASSMLLPSATYADTSIDTGKVESTWLKWTNDLRAEKKLSGYVIDSRLTSTASEWSALAKTRGYISHERKKGDGYYNYAKIEKRFADRGLVFNNIQRTTFSESIGRGYVKCPAWDCTDALIQATKSTWNFFYGERNKKSQPHYKALVNKYFTTMWVGVGVDPVSKRYYLTIHYATSIKPKK